MLIFPLGKLFHMRHYGFGNENRIRREARSYSTSSLPSIAASTMRFT